ncbi:MAG: hypothetical protein ABW138_11280, partial [Candidatus Thiodiazotropha sp. 4PDIVS1]
AHRSSTVVLLQGTYTPSVHAHAGRTQSTEDPLQMAEQLLAYGQVDQAQETLESAIRDCSERVDLHHALLEIYRHRQESRQILSFWNEIKNKYCPAEAEWHDLIDQLNVKWKDHEQ